MKIANKVKLKYFLVLSLAFAFTILSVKSLDTSFSKLSRISLHPTISDTVIPVSTRAFKRIQSKLPKDSLPKKRIDTTITIVKKDSFDFKLSKDTLDAPVAYDAQDSLVYDVDKKKISLYGKETKTSYKDNELTAPLIELNQETGDITASIRRDSTGKVIAMPTFNQADFKSQSDSIRFNMKSGKGLTKSTYTQQGEMYVYGQVIKKTSPDVFFVKRGRITTCDLDTPHFAFVSNRFKFISKKLAITGPIHPEFEGVPVPIYLPFGIFPLSQGRHSGILAPAFTANEQRGIGLENGGYYKILGPYWDAIFKANVYSYGGWTASLNPRYMRRYRYSGQFNIQVMNFVNNQKGDPDYSKSRTFNVTWNHSMDSKARPGVSFSANVNAGSSRFNSNVPDNPMRNFQNILQSNITYSKTWKDKPYNLTIAANHSQNTNQKSVYVTLPDVGFTVNTVYPFRPKDFVGTPKWFENLGIGYSGQARSQAFFYDTVPNIFKRIADTLQYGVHHSVPISLSLPPLGIFQVAPYVSYDETWFQRRNTPKWNPTKNKIDTFSSKGFYTERQMSFGLNVSTAIFGMIVAKSKTSKIVAIRHEIRPTVGISYHPDLNPRGSTNLQVDSSGYRQHVSIYNGNLFAPYGYGRSGGINFAIDNTLQMKIRSRKDTGENAVKKVSIIDGLGLSGYYDFLKDSFQLSNLTISARSTLLDKINITGSAIIDPYQQGPGGRDLKELIIKKSPLSLGRLTAAQLGISSHFQGGSEQSKKSTTNTGNPITPGYTQDEYSNELNYIRNNPAEYADFKIPWSINFTYALTYSKVYDYNTQKVKNQFSQDVNFNGTLNLTPKWQIGMNGFYNLTQQYLGLLSVSISREMHCWQMGINLSPVGKYRFFSISISPKSGLLRDLKINRTRSFYEGI